MECILIPELDMDNSQFRVPENEMKHLKALHINSGDELLATNGKGLSSAGKINFEKNKISFFYPVQFYEKQGELNFPLALALGILDNKDRFEFALEKAVELGITEFYPLLTKYSQRKNLNPDRLNSKAIAAMTQCKRSCLPVIHQPAQIKVLISTLSQYKRIILADVNGKIATKSGINKPTIVFIGPEGGFSDEEISIIKSDKKCETLNLGNRRLRAETAAMLIVGLVSQGY